MNIYIRILIFMILLLTGCVSLGIYLPGGERQECLKGCAQNWACQQQCSQQYRYDDPGYYRFQP